MFVSTRVVVSCFLFILDVFLCCSLLMLLGECFAGPGLRLPAHFSPIYFPMGNAATGFFVTFALLAAVFGAASAISGLNHIRSWSAESLGAASSAAVFAWTLTILAMGYVFTHLLFSVNFLLIRNPFLNFYVCFDFIFILSEVLVSFP